jgi:uncharacterized phage protein (TIGR01671 family)
MRETKFRGKRVDNGEWVYGSLVVPNIGTTCVYIYNNAGVEFSGELAQWEVDPESAGEYTGLQDKKAVDIYEGDLAINAVGEKGIIRYKDGAFYLYYFDEPAKQYLHLSVIKDKDYNSTGKCDIEVIGNIHEPKK